MDTQRHRDSPKLHLANYKLLTLLACNAQAKNECYALRDVTGTSGGAAVACPTKFAKGRLSLAMCGKHR